MAAKHGRKERPPASPRKPSGEIPKALLALKRFGGPILIALSFCLLAAWSWRKWPDVLVDFGRELYVPWQISEGRILYKEIASLFGPFSPYLNAFFFKVFGVSLTTLIVCNLLILVGLIILLFRFFDRICDRLTASAVCLVLICIFAFSQYVVTGNYNFVTPYSHEATHSIVLAVVMIYALHRFALSGNTLPAGLAGLCLGLILLTKAEVAIASIATAALCGILRFWRPNIEANRRGLPLVNFACGLLLSQTVFFLYFKWHMTTAEACRALLGCWIPLLHGGVTANTFYAAGAGLDDAAANSARLIGVAVKIGLFLAFAVAMDAWFAHWKKPAFLFPLLLSAGLFLVLILRPDLAGWEEIGRPLPLLTLIVLGTTLWMLFKNRADPHAAVPFALLSAWALLSLVLLAKMILNARLYHYGFYLAMPATLTIIWALLWLLPNILSRKRGRGLLFKWIMLAAIGAGLAYHLRWSNRFYEAKSYPLARGGDEIITYEEDMRRNKALELIKSTTARSATMLVLPEGASLNYLSKHENPTPYFSFLPPEMSFYGEDKMLAALKGHKPDVVVLVHRHTSEYGVGFFGSDMRYGKQILDWIYDEYAPAALIGAEPLQNEQFRIKILKRKGE